MTLYFFLGNFASVIEAKSGNLICQVEDITVIEWHVVTVTTKDNQVILVDKASMTVSCCWSLAFNVIDLSCLLMTMLRRICGFKVA